MEGHHWIILLIAGIAGIIGVILLCYLWISRSAKPYLFKDIHKIPFNRTVLVLGTAKFAPAGGINLYYKYRMKAAAELYHAGKGSHFIVSGAGRLNEEDEAADMEDSLIRRGIPGEKITRDEWGLRTLDSLVRCSRVFGENKITVVSQRFHVERAVFTGRKLGMNVAGFIAAPVRGKIAVKMILREGLARIKCILDLYILDTRPAASKKF